MKTLKTSIITFPVAVLAIVAPFTAKAETLICSRFEFFNSQTLNDFDGADEGREISDWSAGEPFPHNVSKIVIALPKSEVEKKFGCVDQTERLVPGVREAITNNSSAIGSSPEEYDKIVIGKYSRTSLFGPITTKTSYLRESSIVVQVIVTSDAEPFRSINAIERYYDLPLGYCEKHANCGVEYGKP
ncbi:MAG: hypothetical protein ABJP33_03300 [Pseudoruegeria sp.]